MLAVTVPGDLGDTLIFTRMVSQGNSCEFGHYNFGYSFVRSLRIYSRAVHERHYTEKDGLALAGKPDLDSYTFRSPTEWEDDPIGNNLLVFFMHSDCDGEISAMDVQYLATAFHQHHVAQQVDRLPGGRIKADCQHFLKFLQDSVSANADWEFC